MHGLLTIYIFHVDLLIQSMIFPMEILGCFIPWFIKSPWNQDFSWDPWIFAGIWVRKNGISLDKMGGDHGILMMIWI
jgi:hypothetical protein